MCLEVKLKVCISWHGDESIGLIEHIFNYYFQFFDNHCIRTSHGDLSVSPQENNL